MKSVTARIAFRNLKAHKTKTLIIGVLFALGVLVLVVGNSFMDSISDGLEESYINNYTGNLFISSSKLETPSLTFNPELMESSALSIPSYRKVESHILSLEETIGTAGQLNGIASIAWGEKGEGIMMMTGVDPESYRELFPEGVNLTEGSFLRPGEEGTVISVKVAEMLSDSAGETIGIGDQLLLTSTNSSTGMKIRKVTVRGIHDYGTGSPDLALISFIDPENLRIINGMTASAGSDGLSAKADAEAKASELFETGFDEDALFGGSGSLFSEESGEPGASAAFGEEELLSILGDTSLRDRLNMTDPDAWSYLLVKIEDDGGTGGVVRELNRWFENEGIEARAWEWVDGAGISAALARTLQLVFNGLIIIVAVVAVIIIMNTLVISVTERFGEIGTMRAIGARKGFVRSMILQETLMISLFFGLAGMIAGAGILAVIGAVGIEASNPFLMMLLGSGTFRPSLSLTAIISSLLMVSIVGVAASLYPAALALKISPLQAMNRE
jgi:putative ABC transport system permease protein